jgi:hypothetical protein
MRACAVFRQGPDAARLTGQCAGKPSGPPVCFKSAFAKRRCIVPADAFYEWKPVTGGKQPYAIARQDGQPMAFGAAVGGFQMARRGCGAHVHYHHYQRQCDRPGPARPNARDPGNTELARMVG